MSLGTKCTRCRNLTEIHVCRIVRGSLGFRTVPGPAHTPNFRKEAEVSTIGRMFAHELARPVALALTALISLSVGAGILVSLFLQGVDAQSGGGIEGLLYARLREDGCIKHPKIDYEIHVRGIHGRTLQDAVFKRRSPDGDGFDVIASAGEGGTARRCGPQAHLDRYETMSNRSKGQRPSRLSKRASGRSICRHADLDAPFKNRNPAPLRALR